MRIHLALIAASLLLVSASARAQQPDLGDGHGPGVGVEENLGGLSGGAFVYDGGHFRIDVLLGLDHSTHPGGNVTDFGLGGRVFFVVHRMDHADLALGGGLAVVHRSVGSADETNLQFEGAAQIRAFLTTNVALSGSLGFVVVTADNVVLEGGPVTPAGGSGAFGIGGQLLAGFGATYFFR
jgi:hypothetical protein